MKGDVEECDEVAAVPPKGPAVIELLSTDRLNEEKLRNAWETFHRKKPLNILTPEHSVFLTTADDVPVNVPV